MRFDPAERFVNFGLYYPVFQTESGKGLKRRNGNVAAGIYIDYQLFFPKSFGVAFSTGAWFIPVKISADKAIAYGLNLETGPVVRIFPDTFFDPILKVEGGIARVRIGGLGGGKISFPVTPHFGLNLWRTTTRFQDPSLSLYVFGEYRYYFKMAHGMQPGMVNAGLAIRGSF